ncbi:quinolone resistance protein NorA-like isoform X1 [Anthonomus grandis grandis]|uniref:quinolone resistance protein NorA-like isoform X1 n=1 Tax=Anthonomus grandis grandis TaxID=2921223 RepID=UPI00216666F1|nr:quinolone resistance protein NorA-like isoform X1 [Anthonomus grandis grandis]
MIQLLYILFAMDMFNLAIFLPIFNGFAMSLGGTPSIIGLVESSYYLVCLIWNPIAGSLSDHIGRKGLLTKCLTASAIGYVIITASTSLSAVFLGRVISAFGGSVTILLRSMVGDIYESPENKREFFRHSALLNCMAFLVGSVITGFLSELQYGYRLCFLLMVCSMSTASFLAQCSLPHKTYKPPKSSMIQDQSLFKSGLNELKIAIANLKNISWPRYKSLFIIKAGFDFAIMVITANIGLILLEEYNIKGRYLGFTFLLISTVSIVTNMLQIKIIHFFGNISEYDILIRGGMIMIISFIGMATFVPVLLFLIFMIVNFMIRAFVDTLLIQIITIKTRENDRGKVIGAFENVRSLAGFFAPPISGLIAEVYGPRIAVLSAVVPLTIALSMVSIANKKKTKSK